MFFAQERITRGLDQCWTRVYSRGIYFQSKSNRQSIGYWNFDQVGNQWCHDMCSSFDLLNLCLPTREEFATHYTSLDLAQDFLSDLLWVPLLYT